MPSPSDTQHAPASDHTERQLDGYLIPASLREAARKLAQTPSAFDTRFPFTQAGLTLNQARARFEQVRQKLAEDALAFWAKPALPQRQPTAPSGASVTDALATLVKQQSGVVVGEVESSLWSKRLLIDAMPMFKQQGVKTLYLAPLMQDVHQEALDQYGSMVEGEMPPTLRHMLTELDMAHQIAPDSVSSYVKLVQAAHAQGIRVVAADCLASRNLAGLSTTTSAESLMNYFSWQLINDQQRQADAGLWLALVHQKRSNTFNRVPGLAELTGTLGIRVQLPPLGFDTEQSLLVAQDSGEWVTHPGQSIDSYNVKADWVVGDRPVISKGDLNLRLQRQGDYVILARPQSASFQLRYYAGKNDVLSVDIHRDRLSGALYIQHTASRWKTLNNRRFSSIAQLDQALRAEARLVTNRWDGVTPILPEADQPIVAAPVDSHSAGELSVADEPWRKYHMPSLAHARNIALRDLNPESRTPSRAENRAADQALEQVRSQLQQDSTVFFNQLPTLPARPAVPEIAPGATLLDVLPSLLAASPGLIFGETHTDFYGTQTLIEALPQLFELGVRTLYLEVLVADVIADDLRRYQLSTADDMPIQLEKALDYAENGSRPIKRVGAAGAAEGVSPDGDKRDFSLAMKAGLMGPQTFENSYEYLVRTAHKVGLNIVPIDCLAAKQQDLLARGQGLDVIQRDKMMNYYAKLVIEGHQARVGAGKWVALMGAAHGSTHSDIPGVAELTGALAIRVDYQPMLDAISLAPGTEAKPRWLKGIRPGAIIIRTDSAPRHLALDAGEIRYDMPNTRGSRLLKSDLLLCRHPTVAASALDVPLRQQPNKFLIRCLSESSPFSYELRYYSAQQQRVLAAPIVANAQGELSVEAPELPEIHQHLFDSYREIVFALEKQRQMVNVWGDATPQTPTQTTTVSVAQQRQLMASLFEQQRQGRLIQLSCASDDEQQAFKAGRAAYQAELADLQLAEHDLPSLKQYWLEHSAKLTPRQQGALLEAVERYQLALLQQKGSEWQQKLASLGASQLQLIQQNRYLAATERLQGVCAALSAHLAAAWLMDQHEATASQHVSQYIERFNQAIDDPTRPSAQLLGLGLSHWSFIDEPSKFAANPRHSAQIVDAALKHLAKQTPPVVFELSFGEHALALGVRRQGEGRVYFMADPNFGSAEFASQSACAQALSSVTAGQRLHVRQYRADLAEQALLPKRAGSRWPHRAQSATPELTLADLGKNTDLAQRFNAGHLLEHDAWFQQQQQRLRLAEYRASPWQQRLAGQQPGIPVDGLLLALLQRHQRQIPAPIRVPDARLIDVQLQGDHAHLLFDAGEGLAFPPVTIDGAQYPHDVNFVRQYWQLMQRIRQPAPRGWLDWLLGRRGVDLQQVHLASALSDEGMSPQLLARQLDWEGEASARAQPELPNSLLSLRLAHERQQALSLAERFRQSVSGMLEREPEPERWIPIIETAEAEPEGQVKLAFRDRFRPEEVKTLASADRAALELKDYLAEKHRAIAQLDAGHLPGEEATVDGLNSAFALQLLVRKLTRPAGEAAPTLQNKNLALAIEIQDYLNSGQIIQGVAQDLSHIAQLVKVALNAEASGSLLVSSGSLLGKLGVALQVANVALDIYELTQANSESQRVLFGTHLAFDSAGLAAMGASLLGVEVAGPIGVLFAGLGIGVGALASQFAAIGEQAGREVGGYFAALATAYQSGGYQWDAEHHALKPCYPAVVVTLDLKLRQVTLDSPRLYASSHWSSVKVGMTITGMPTLEPDLDGKSNTFLWAGDTPKIDYDRNKAIDICRRLKFAEHAALPSVSEPCVIVLPATPRHYIDYRYEALPFATWRQDAGFDCLRKLEGHDFVFDFNIFPLPYLINHLLFNYDDTLVSVHLGAEKRVLQMPVLPESMHGYLHYYLENEGGQCVIGLKEGARLTLSCSGSGAAERVEWVLDARGLQDDTLSYQAVTPHWSESGTLKVGSVEMRAIALEERPGTSPWGSVTLLAKDGSIARLNPHTLARELLEIDASQWPSKSASFDAELQRLAKSHQLGVSTVMIKHYAVPVATGQAALSIDQAWFDVARSRMLYLLPTEGYKGAELALVTDDAVYFYNQAHTKVLRVDPEMHQIVARFALRDEQKLRVWTVAKQVMLGPLDSNVHYAAVFAVVNDQLMLQRLHASDTLIAELNGLTRLNDIASTLHKALEGNLTTRHGQVAEQSALLPLNQWIIIDAVHAGQLNQRLWLRSRDGALLKPNFQPPEPKPESWSVPDDMALVHHSHLATGEEVFYFYSQQAQQLYRQVGWGEARYDAAKVTAQRQAMSGLKQVSGLESQLYATFDDGSVRQLAADGEWLPSALNGLWFKAHAAQWVTELRKLSQGHTLSLLDLRRASGEPLPAWASDGHIVLAGAGLGAQAQWVGLNPDNQSAWLYEPTSGVLYQQPLLSETALVTALGSSLQLRDELPLTPPAPRLRLGGLQCDGDTLSVELLDGVLPPAIHGIRQVLLAPCQAMEYLLISPADWAANPQMALDLARLPTPGQASDKLQIDVRLDNPLGLSLSREEDDVLLSDRVNGRALRLIKAWQPGFAAKSELSVCLPNGVRLDLAQIQQALSPTGQEILQLLG